MPGYRDLVQKYQKRKRDTLVDVVTTGLSFADDVAVDMTMMENSGLLSDIADAASAALPFAVIAVTEGGKVLFGKKTGLAGAQDATFRMVKTGAAMGAGAAAAALGAPLLATVPVAMSVRALLDKYKSRSMTSVRVDRRAERLRSIRDRLSQRRGVAGL